MDASWKKNYIRYKTVLLGTLDQYQKKADIKVYVEILLSLATISIFSIFALRPTLITIAQLIKDIDSKKEVLARMEAKLEKLDEAQITYDREKDNITLLQTAIPFIPQPNVFIRQAEGISNRTAAVNNMSIDEAVILGSSSPAKSSEQLTQFPEDVISTGINISSQADINNYNTTFEFYKSMEKLRTPLLIDSFSLTIDESEEGKKLIIVFINGRLASLKRLN